MALRENDAGARDRLHPGVADRPGLRQRLGESQDVVGVGQVAAIDRERQPQAAPGPVLGAVLQPCQIGAGGDHGVQRPVRVLRPPGRRDGLHPPRRGQELHEPLSVLGADGLGVNPVPDPPAAHQPEQCGGRPARLQRRNVHVRLDVGRHQVVGLAVLRLAPVGLDPSDGEQDVGVLLRQATSLHGDDDQPAWGRRPARC